MSHLHWVTFGGRRYNAYHVQDDLWMVKRLRAGLESSDNQADWDEAQVRCATSDSMIAIAAAVNQWESWA